jgi:predicted RNase H-like HicB family nuclease
MKRHFPIILEQDEDGVFIVECPTYRGCRSYGETIEQAIFNIREAIEVCLEEQGPEFANLQFIGLRDLEMATS